MLEEVRACATSVLIGDNLSNLLAYIGILIFKAEDGGR